MLFHSVGTDQTVRLKMNHLYLVEQIKTVYLLGYLTDGVYTRYGAKAEFLSIHRAVHSSDETSLALNTLVSRFLPFVLKSLNHLAFYLYLFFGSWFFSFYLLLFKTNLRENCDPFFKSTETYGYN